MDEERQDMPNDQNEIEQTDEKSDKEILLSQIEENESSMEMHSENNRMEEETTGLAIVREAYEWIESFVVAALAVVILFTFVLRIVGVDGPSMYSTLENKDRVVISHFMFKPKNGDIIVTTQPTDIPGIKSDRPLIKRIIATGGQKIEVDYDSNTVYVDGVAQDEPYINRTGILDPERGLKSSDPDDPMLNRGDNTEYPYYVPEGKVFVMGDNRNNSMDSRSPDVGLIDEKYILGKLIIRLYPINRFGIVR